MSGDMQTHFTCTKAIDFDLFQESAIQEGLLGQVHKFFAQWKLVSSLSRRHPQQEQRGGCFLFFSFSETVNAVCNVFGAAVALQEWRVEVCEGSRRSNSACLYPGGAGCIQSQLDRCSRQPSVNVF